MRTVFPDQDIKIRIDSVVFHALNIVFEVFLHSVPMHSHGNNCYEIHYIPYGNGFANIEGISHRITPNTLYTTGPHVFHEQVPYKEDPMAEYCIYFNLQRADKSRKKDVTSPAEKFIGTPFWFGQDKQNIYPVIQQLFYELEHKNTGYVIMAEALMQEFVIKLVRNYEGTENADATHSSAPNLVDRKYLIAEESFLYDYETLTLEELAQKLGLGNRQTERFLMDCYGKTFQQKKAEAKMSMASILLDDRSLSVAQIAEKLNYSTPQHFSASFNQYYGISPSKWRKKGHT